MVMERASMDMDAYIARRSPLPLAVALAFSKDVLRGLRHIHSCHITHRDLKPQNCLIFEALPVDIAKICDFGSGKQTAQDLQWSKGVGTVTYMAPEVLRGEKKLTSKVDVYSFSLIFFQLLTGQMPYPSIDHFALPHQIATGVRPKIPASLSKPFRKILEASWHQNPKKRPSAEHLLNLLETKEIVSLISNN